MTAIPYVAQRRRKSTRTEDRAAVNRLLGLVDDPTAHGRHAMTPLGRVNCGGRQYKWGYAPCQLSPVPCTHNLIETDTRGNTRCLKCSDFVRFDLSADTYVTI